jgi:hypothetical protein
VKPEERRRLGLATAGALAGAAAAEFARGNGARAHRFGAAAAGVFLVPTLLRNCGWWGPVMTTFPTRRREVWLTIDDGPDPEETPRVLDVLREFGRRLSENIRPADLACSYGGEEFVVIMPDTSQTLAHAAGERLR